jgi:uncharacterized RDD family membrane protein YckC
MNRSVAAVPHEARRFQGHRAGLVSRLVAAGVDLGVTLATLVVIYAAATTLVFILDPRGFQFPTPSLLTMWIVAMIVLAAYFMAAWSTTGRTYGQHLMGLRVVNSLGGRLRVFGAVLRAVFCVVFPVGLFWVALSRENRSLQDLVLRTSVIHDWLVRIPRKD